MKYIKYLMSLLYIFVPIILFTIIITLLNYFDIINYSILKYLSVLFMIISFLIGGIYIGKKTDEKGWLEGIKVGGISIIILLLFTLIFYGKFLNFERILYYIILITSSMFGSSIGINKKSN